MFSWIVGDSCKSSCVGSDPTTDTVKIVPDDINSEKLEAERLQREVKEKQEQLRLDEERRRAEEEEIERQERARQEREDKERKEREEEELARQREEERLRLEEQCRQAEEAARVEAERRERARLQAQERARREEEAARARLQEWLKANNYGSVNTKKSKMMMARYPLHDAVSQKDSTMINLLLRFGADATLKNSSGKTAQEVAKAMKGGENLTLAFSTPRQPSMKIGGA